MVNKFEIPLMSENIDNSDINSLIDFLGQSTIPKLTNGPKVVEFETEWGKWLGSKYNLFVNSGASANELTMLALSHIYGTGEIIIPPLTWISDVSAILFSGCKPIFCDINLKNLSFDLDKLKQLITKETKAIFITHVLGLNALTDELIDICKENNIHLIEDVCESHGALHNNKKVGNFGLASNFSFYYAHHMSTIEGGMISTNDEYFYQICRALRSHGMSREITNINLKNQFIEDNPQLNKDFIFIRPSHNFRSTELNAVIGLSQLPKLSKNNNKRIQNFNYFINKLNNDRYITELDLNGQSSYAFIVILKMPSFELRNKIEKALSDNKIEFRRGLSGGGNQLRQPYFKEAFKNRLTEFKNVEHVHDFSWYIGNYPSLEIEKINFLLKILNSI